jgi:hypothetical protein
MWSTEKTRERETKKNEKKVCGDESRREREKISFEKKNFLRSLQERPKSKEFSPPNYRTRKGITYPNSV